MQLFYNPYLDKDTQQVTFDKIESKHLIKVLRKKEGDLIYITNGKGLLFISRINIASDKKCLATIFKVEEKNNQRDYHLHVAIAPTKSIDRFEWFLEKATEIGIDEITPILTNNSERKGIKKDRLEKIIQAAMKQSLKYHLPVLHEMTSFDDFLTAQKDKNVYIAHCNTGEKSLMKQVVKPNESIVLLIGPEGDFSLTEIEKALKAGCTEITLGETRLRTETAALVAVQNMAFINQ